MGRTAERGAVHPRCIVPASCSPFGGMTRITFARTVPPALLAVQPPQLLMVHDYPLALKRPMKPSIAKPPAQPRKLAQPLPKYRVVRSTAAMARRCAIRSYDKTRPPLANRKRNAQVSDGLAPGGGRHLFCRDILQSSHCRASHPPKASSASHSRLPESQPTRLRHLKTTVLHSPLVQRHSAEPIFARKVRSWTKPKGSRQSAGTSE
jgi:hypothetical protein